MKSLVLAVLLISALRSVLCFQGDLISPTGRNIAARHLRRYFPEENEVSLSNRIFEVTKDGVLHGQGQSVNMMTDVKFSTTVKRAKRTEVIINGISRPDIDVNVDLKVGDRYTLAVDETGTPLLVQGPGLKLSSLSHVGLYGVFVNHANGTVGGGHHKINLEGDAVQATRISQSKVDERQVLSPLSRQASCASLTPKREVELAIDFDHTFCEQNGGTDASATSAIVALMEAVQVPYTEATCLQFVLTRVRGFCDETTDPYAEVLATYESNPILTFLQSYWNENEGAVARDTVHLISGFQRENTAKGIAFLGVVCSLQSAYAWSEPLKEIIAHELGHNFDANHVASGIMIAVNDGSQPFEFIQESIDEITGYVDSTSASCLAAIDSGVTPSPSPAPSTTATSTATATATATAQATTTATATAQTTSTATATATATAEAAISASPSVSMEPSQSAAASESPDPSASKSSLPSTSSAPPTRGENCADAFVPGADIAARCKRFRIHHRPLTLIAIQQFGRIDVKLSKAKNVDELGYAVTTDEDVDPSSISRVPFSKATIKQTFDLSSIAIPSGAINCCREKIFILASVQLTKRGETSVVNVKEAITYRCYDPCARRRSGGNILQQSSSRRCARCK